MADFDDPELGRFRGFTVNLVDTINGLYPLAAAIVRVIRVPAASKVRIAHLVAVGVRDA